MTITDEDLRKITGLVEGVVGTKTAALEKLVIDLHASTQRELQELRTEVSELRTDTHQGLKRIEEVIGVHRGMHLTATIGYKTLQKAVLSMEQREIKREQDMRAIRERVRLLEKKKPR